MQPAQKNEAAKTEPDIDLPEDDSCEKSEKCEAPETTILLDNPWVKETTEDWSSELEKLRLYFAQCSLPSEPFLLDQCTQIINPDQFIQAHLATLDRYNGRESGKPVLQRLRRLKELLIINSKN